MRDSKSEMYINWKKLTMITEHDSQPETLCIAFKGYDTNPAHSLGISPSPCWDTQPLAYLLSTQHRVEPLADCEAQNSDVPSYTFLTYFSTYRRFIF